MVWKKRHACSLSRSAAGLRARPRAAPAAPRSAQTARPRRAPRGTRGGSQDGGRAPQPSEEGWGGRGPPAAPRRGGPDGRSGCSGPPAARRRSRPGCSRFRPAPRLPGGRRASRTGTGAKGSAPRPSAAGAGARQPCGRAVAADARRSRAQPPLAGQQRGGGAEGSTLRYVSS